MMKTTQFLTNIKFWQSSLVALLFLFSFTVNSQSVGDDLMAASNGALSTLSDDATNGVDGQGGGCVPCGWSGAAGVNYAPTTAGHGPVHSGDRMWKTFAGNGGNGEFVNQQFTDIAAGTYTLTFYHRWTNAGNLDYSAGPGPQVSFKKSDGNSGWLDGYAAEVPQGNIGADAEWTENVHTIEVSEAGTYRMQVYKNGGTNASPNPMNGSLHLDTFSLVYTAEPAVTYSVNITSAGGNYTSEKWVNVTTEANGAGTQVWGQGDGSYANGVGLINQDIQLEAGTYYVNAYDQYSDGWDGTTLTVSQGSIVLVDGVMPTDGVDADASSAWESADSGELEGSYEITVSPPPLDCVYTLTLNDQYSDGWDNSDGSMNTLDVLVDGAVSGSYFLTGGSESFEIGAYYGQVISFQYNVAGSGNWASENSYVVTDASGNEVASGNSSANAESLSCSSDPVPVLSLQGVIDIDVSGGVGKGVHLVASGDAADLSAYGIGSANNQQGTDGEEFTLSGSISAGQHILITNSAADATGADVFLEGYLGASEVFDLILNGAGSALQGNGNDAYELFFNGEVIDTFGVTGNVGDDSQSSDYSMDWAYRDSWAYVVDGAWTYGGNDCTDDSETSCESSCPYPFIADACPFVPVVIDGGACLDFEGDSATDGWRFQDLGGADSDWQLDSPAVSGDNSLGHGYFPSTTAFQDIAVSPTFNTSAMTDAQLRYSEYMNWSSYGTANYVMYTLDDPATLDPATANVVILDTEINAAAEDTWVERVFDLPEAEQVTLLFYYVGTNGHDWNIDDVCVEEVPPPPFHDVTFNVDARNIIVHDRGMFMGGGVLGGSDAVPMSDDDGDGIWTATLNLQEGTTGEWIFLNSPGDGGDWGTKEDLGGQACATGEYNDRAVPAFDADNLVFNYCFGVCNDTNSFCAEQAVRHDVTFTVGTANIEVGESGMHLGDGLFGGSNGHAMVDNGDDTHSVTISIPEGTAGNYAFFNGPNSHYDWGTKEDLEGQDCADADNFNNRYLDAVTEAGSVSFCYGTCEESCDVGPSFAFPWSDNFESGSFEEGGWNLAAGSEVSNIWTVNDLQNTTEGGGLSAHHGYSPLDNYVSLLITPALDLSGATNPVLSYNEQTDWSTYAETQSVLYSTDYNAEMVDPLNEATWYVLNDVISEEDVWVSQSFALPTESSVAVVFLYTGYDGSEWHLDDVSIAEAPAEPNFVTADPNYEWGGYMVVFDVDGNYMFESGWDVADLQTTLNPDVPNIILEPNFNTYNAEDPYWSNGEIGNKIMLATTQVESDNLYNGVGLTFSGSVAEHTLGEDYEAVYFIKCLDQSAGWTDMLNAEYEIPLPESGEFSVSVSGDLLPEGKLVQFGFYVRGLNANPALDYGKVVIGDIGLSIGDNDSLDMVIYPNPVNGDYVTIQTPLNGDKLVEVFDVNGRKVMERLLTTDTLNVGSISAGMYIVKVTVEGQSNVSKLIVE